MSIKEKLKQVQNLSETPINLKPCNDGEVFWIEAGYCKELDMTFIMRNKSKNGAVIGQEVCGFYHGEPDSKFINEYTNEVYWEDEDDETQKTNERF